MPQTAISLHANYVDQNQAGNHEENRRTCSVKVSHFPPWPRTTERFDKNKRSQA